MVLLRELPSFVIVIAEEFLYLFSISYMEYITASMLIFLIRILLDLWSTLMYHLAIWITTLQDLRILYVEVPLKITALHMIHCVRLVLCYLVELIDMWERFVCGFLVLLFGQLHPQIYLAMFWLFLLLVVYISATEICLSVLDHCLEWFAFWSLSFGL